MLFPVHGHAKTLCFYSISSALTSPSPQLQLSLTLLSTHLPEGLVEETIQTLSLLLPLNDRQTSTWFLKQQISLHLDAEATLCRSLSKAERNISNFASVSFHLRSPRALSSYISSQPPLNTLLSHLSRTLHPLTSHPNCPLIITNIPSYHRDRLTTLKQAYDEAKPSTVQQAWSDRRNPSQWYNFWIAGFLILALTVLLGIIQAVEGALQVYKAYHPT